MTISYPVKILGALILVSVSFLAVIAGTVALLHVCSPVGIVFIFIGTIAHVEVMYRCDEYLEQNKRQNIHEPSRRFP